MTDQLKTDLSVIRNRGYLDPNFFTNWRISSMGRFCKWGVEGSLEFYSSRISKKERKQNLTEEVMGDSAIAGYAKRKYNDYQTEKQNQHLKRSTKRPTRKKSKRH